MPGWTVSGHAVPERLREDRGVLPAMLDGDPPGRPGRARASPAAGRRGPASADAPARRGSPLQVVGRRAASTPSSAMNRPSDRAVALAVAAPPAMRARWMFAAGFVPGAERAGGDVRLDALGRARRARRIPSRGSCRRRWWRGASASRRAIIRSRMRAAPLRSRWAP